MKHFSYWTEKDRSRTKDIKSIVLGPNLQVQVREGFHEPYLDLVGREQHCCLLSDKEFEEKAHEKKSFIQLSLKEALTFCERVKAKLSEGESFIFFLSREKARVFSLLAENRSDLKISCYLRQGREDELRNGFKFAIEG